MSDELGVTSLIVGAYEGHFDVVKLLLGMKANIEASGTSDYPMSCFLCSSLE
jgi:ankyrin repeat protein